jgi:hypothetical protein
MIARLQPPERLIRQIDTGLYLSETGEWVANEEEAYHFPDLRSALAFCEQMQERRVEMVLIFGDNARAGRVWA